MRITRAETPCPSCGAPNTGHATMGEPAVPAPGDVSVCGDCVEPAFYTDAGNGALGLRAMTAEERAKVLADPGVAKVRSTVLTARLMRLTGRRP